ncbi:helix-turn-helix transcriptional regulator [Pseudomonas sp. 148P]|uniref:Helix-turn-helix transcriptional regulator n=1 Tax=Pseudomonas ulcerans TaxID=3115852 RepID=A0ABU7HUA7_9PSED|nr:MULTISPECIES: helix-turn-helix transcriptional regulator [unclassified Pseudomonas]MEE1923938.1 helix-turn-helix transcriptional regulator [Pseudomonas sp. 147P]MEE1935115.1 helix-turn-helix transcriptional regulator [Pseudomonas sp. 148P]
MKGPPLNRPPLGPLLKRWRLLHRVKQSHAAELFRVSQPTISRWESGLQEPEPEQRAHIEALLRARLDSAADQALARLVNASAQPVHLVCDLSHRLLACSASRAAEFSLPLGELLGRSLWPFVTEAIATQEARLDSLGWRDGLAPPALEFASGANGSLLVPIRHSQCRWTRIILSDGSAARMVETL